MRQNVVLQKSSSEKEELSEDFTKIKNAKLKITEIASKWIDTLNTLEGEHMTV